jgi:hypothetical protein
MVSSVEFENKVKRVIAVACGADPSQVEVIQEIGVPHKEMLTAMNVIGCAASGMLASFYPLLEEASFQTYVNEWLATVLKSVKRSTDDVKTQLDQEEKKPK